MYCVFCKHYWVETHLETSPERERTFQLPWKAPHVLDISSTKSVPVTTYLHFCFYRFLLSIQCICFCIWLQWFWDSLVIVTADRSTLHWQALFCFLLRLFWCKSLAKHMLVILLSKWKWVSLPSPELSVCLTL